MPDERPPATATESNSEDQQRCRGRAERESITRSEGVSMLFTFDPKMLVHPPEEISAFIDGLIKRLIEEGHYYDGPDRRTEKRHVVAMQVHARPLSDSPLLAIELSDLNGKKFQGAVEIRRCRPVGPYFEVAGEYVTKVYDPLATVPGGAQMALSR
jgi:hypothetical protein